MYEFTELNQPAKRSKRQVELILNGENLDHTIRGYRTLTISGRELIGRDIDSQTYKQTASRLTGRERTGPVTGSNVFLASSMNSRLIEVTYQMIGEDERDFRSRFEELMYYLSKEEHRIQGTDDPLFFYTGVLQDVGDVNPASNDVVGTFRFECHDPFKYGVELETFEGNGATEFRKVTRYPVQIETIEITAKTTASFVRITNLDTKDEITINGDVTAGDRYVLDLRSGITRDQNNKNVSNRVDIRSDFEDFDVSFREEVTAGPHDFKITFREKRL